MKTHELKPKQHAVLRLLAEGKTRKEAAQLAGVSERTIYGWLAQDHFKAELKRVEHELWQATLAGLKSGIRRSLSYLLSVLDDPNEPTRERIAAAKTVLLTALRVIQAVELAEIRDRLDALEEKLGANNGQSIAIKIEETRTSDCRYDERF